MYIRISSNIQKYFQNFFDNDTWKKILAWNLIDQMLIYDILVCLNI